MQIKKIEFDSFNITCGVGSRFYQPIYDNHNFSSTNLGQIRLEHPPIRLQNLAGDIIRELLHKHEHSIPQRKHAELKPVQFADARAASPYGIFVINPGVREEALDMLEVEEMAEEELILCESLARDDEREGEGYVVIKGQGIVS